MLEDFGEYFVQYCFRHGYDQLLRTLGKDFFSFIQNLDALHSYLARTYTKLRFPSFRFVKLNNIGYYLVTESICCTTNIGDTRLALRSRQHWTWIWSYPFKQCPSPLMFVSPFPARFLAWQLFATGGICFSSGSSIFSII